MDATGTCRFRTIFEMVYLYLVFAHETGAQTEIANNKTQRDIVIEQSRYFCPFESVCVDKWNTSSVDSSCCKSCSCDPSCVQFSRCCFPDGDQQPPPYQRCVFTRIKANESFDQDLLNSYYMVDTCPDKHEDREHVPCGEMNVAPWGSLFPVYSRTSGLIYKNQACSKCHDATDVIEWNTLLKCRTWIPFSNIEPGLNAHTDLLAENQLPDHCTVEFFPPDGTNWSTFTTNKCFDINLVDHCPYLDFEVPPGFPMEQEAIITACESGFWSPYILGIRARNVFCRICNGFPSDEDENCSAEPTDDIRGDEDLYMFSMLLNTKVVLDSSSKDPEQLSIACKVTNPDDCRQVHCPSGQLRVRVNECKLPSSKWFSNEFDIFIHLVSKDELMFSDFATIVAEKGNLAFKSPLLQFWKTKQIMFQMSRPGFGTFVLNLNYVGEVNNPKRFLSIIEQSLGQKWTFMNGNTTHEAKATFWEFSNIELIGDTIVPKWVLDFELGNSTFLSDVPFLDTTIVRVAGVGHTSTGMVINRLNFCRQISLTEDEYIEFASVVYHKETGKYFFDNQYMQIQTTMHDRVRVCIDDLGYTTKYSEQFDAAFPLHGNIKFNIFVVTIIVLYCYMS